MGEPTSERECFRGACRTGAIADWFNPSTREFYCLACRCLIERENPGLVFVPASLMRTPSAPVAPVSGERAQDLADEIERLIPAAKAACSPIRIFCDEAESIVALLRARAPVAVAPQKPSGTYDEVTCKWSVTGTGSFRCILDADHNGLHHVVFGDAEHFPVAVAGTEPERMAVWLWEYRRKVDRAWDKVEPSIQDSYRADADRLLAALAAPAHECRPCTRDWPHEGVCDCGKDHHIAAWRCRADRCDDTTPHIHVRSPSGEHIAYRNDAEGQSAET